MLYIRYQAATIGARFSFENTPRQTRVVTINIVVIESLAAAHRAMMILLLRFI